MPAASSQILSDAGGPQLVFARLDAVGIEVRLELFGEPQRAVDTDDRRALDEQHLGLVEVSAIGPRCDAVEEPANHLRRIDADRARFECLREVRMLRGQHLAAERGARSGGLADRDEPRGIRVPTAGGLRDQPLGRRVTMGLRDIRAVFSA